MKEGKDIVEVLNQQDISSLVNKSLSLKTKRTEQLKLNFFSLTSELYYRENYHSDFLKVFLEYPEFLRLFTELIISHNPKLNVDVLNYQECEILRETGKIDIWIRDKQSKRSIVIENKINDAEDMDRQIPRYVDYVNASGYKIDAIIYLTLDTRKKPSKKNWSELEKKFIADHLIEIGAYDGSQRDLYSIFYRFESLISDIDLLVLSRQYKNLLSILAHNYMIKPINDELYELVCDEEKFNRMREMSRLFNQLPSIRAQRINKHFETACTPFKKVGIWRTVTAFFDEFMPSESCNFAIDVTCYEERYLVEFFDRNALGNDPASALEFLKTKGVQTFKKKENSNRVEVQFSFPSQEEELYEFLIDLLSKFS